jgi:hypothetical protein
MSERLTRLTAHEHQPAKPESKGSNNDAAPRAIGHDASDSADCDDGQPHYCHSDFVHGHHNSTVEALPHVVTALIAKRAELAGQIEHLQGEVQHLTIALDHVEETLRPRQLPTMHHAFRGEVSRIVLESLRTAAGPLSTSQIAT